MPVDDRQLATQTPWMYTSCYLTERNVCRFRTSLMFEPRIETRFRAYFLRVAFTFKAPVPWLPSPARQPRITCRTFVPRRRGNGYEDLENMQHRIWRDLNDISKPAPISPATPTLLFGTSKNSKVSVNCVVNCEFKLEYWCIWGRGDHALQLTAYLLLASVAVTDQTSLILTVTQ